MISAQILEVFGLTSWITEDFCIAAGTDWEGICRARATEPTQTNVNLFLL